MYLIKRFFDLLFSLIFIIVLSPLLLMISSLIKITSTGSVLFKQKRIGKYGKTFTIYKFRTMIENAEDIGSGIFIRNNDQRITKVGCFLRSTSLDELPQLFNIIKGEMSFVGPRPPLVNYPYKYMNYDDEQKLRFSVLPGISGYAQIKGRNKLSWEEKIKLDLEYINGFTLCLDIKIILLTIYKVIAREGIYNK